MWIELTILVVIAVAALVVILVRRPRSDDLHSVRNYHSALGTLEHISDRPVSSRVQPAASSGADTAARMPAPGGAAGPAGGGSLVFDDAGTSSHVHDHDRGAGLLDLGMTAGLHDLGGNDGGASSVGGPGASAVTRPTDTGRVPPVPVRDSGEFPDPETPLVFDDARPRDRTVAAAPGGTPAGFRTSRAQRMALHSMNRRPRRMSTAVIATVVVVVFTVLAVVGSRHAGPQHRTTATVTTQAVTTHSTLPSSAHQGGHTTTTVHHKPVTTRTTLPSQFVASTTTATTATYPVINSAYNIQLTATGACWVDVTTVSSGAVLWTGTLQAGDQQLIQANGATAVELGSTSTTLSVDSVPVVFPTTMHTPFVATFEPPTPAGAVTTTTVPPTSGATATTGASGAAAG